VPLRTVTVLPGNNGGAGGLVTQSADGGAAEGEVAKWTEPVLAAAGRGRGPEPVETNVGSTDPLGDQEPSGGRR